jgi:hypothetical protein
LLQRLDRRQQLFNTRYYRELRAAVIRTEHHNPRSVRRACHLCFAAQLLRHARSGVALQRRGADGVRDDAVPRRQQIVAGATLRQLIYNKALNKCHALT